MTHWPMQAMLAVVLAFIATMTFPGRPSVGSSGSPQGQIPNVSPRPDLAVEREALTPIAALHIV